jgi:signal transduction histidine kinase
MTDFLGQISHELVKPIGVIRTALQDLSPRQPLPAEAKVRNRLAVTTREVDRLERLVENFADASKVEWERLDLQQDRQDLTKMICDVVKLYETYASNQIFVSAPDAPVYVLCDPARMTQVMHTLVSNAIQRSRPGAIIQAQITVEGDYAVLAVSDRGPLLTQEAIDRMFQALAGPVAPGSPGTLGVSVALSVAKRVVQGHGGRIGGSSTRQNGTTFRLSLPRVEVATDGAARETPREEAAQPPR